MSLATFGVGSDYLATHGVGWDWGAEEVVKSGEMVFELSTVIVHERDGFFRGEFLSDGVVSLFTIFNGIVNNALTIDGNVLMTHSADGFVTGVGG